MTPKRLGLIIGPFSLGPPAWTHSLPSVALWSSQLNIFVISGNWSYDVPMPSGPECL